MRKPESNWKAFEYKVVFSRKKTKFFKLNQSVKSINNFDFVAVKAKLTTSVIPFEAHS